MKESTQLPVEHHADAVLLPVAAEFDRLLRVRVRTVEFHHNGGTEHDAVIEVPCSKPAQPGPPSAEAAQRLHRLAPYVRAFTEVLDAQQRRGFDAEALEGVCAAAKEVGDMQGIRAQTVDLSCYGLQGLPGLEDTWL